MYVLATYFNRNCLTESVVNVGNDNACAFTSETTSHLGTNAACPTGNECSLTG
jgi:hypothetical protein